MVSVVIPVRNGDPWLDRQLAALAAQEGAPPFEVVVADNGSTDGTVATAMAWCGRLDLHVVPAAPPGINVARNTGARAARGSLLLFCDADDEVGPGWVAAMAKAGEGAALLGGSVDHVTLNPPGRRPQVSTALTGGGLPVGLGFLPYPIGCCCGVRADVFHALDGFDEAFASGGDEVEFFWRAQLAGHALAYVPDAVVQYRQRPGARSAFRQTRGYGIAKAQLYAHFREHVPRESWFRVIFSWLAVLSHARDLLFKGRRLDYVRRVGNLVGQVEGSVRYRVRHLAE